MPTSVTVMGNHHGTFFCTTVTLWCRCRSVTKHLPSRSDPVSEPVCREADVPIDESHVAPGSMQISPRDLALGQGESLRSSLEKSNPTTVRRRIVGKRTVSSPCTFGFIR